MPLASATFRLAGGEEFELHLKPGTGTGFLGVQNVGDSVYQAKIRKKDGVGFVSLPASKSVLLAAWWYAKAFKARHDGTLEGPSFKAACTEVRGRELSPKLSLSPHLVCKRDGRQVVGRRRFSSRSRSDRTENGLLLSRLAGMLRMCALVRCAAVQAVAV